MLWVLMPQKCMDVNGGRISISASQKMPIQNRKGNYMEEKVYKTMNGTGTMNIVLGVITLVMGVAGGVLMIVGGAKLLYHKSKIMF